MANKKQGKKASRNQKKTVNKSKEIRTKPNNESRHHGDCLSKAEDLTFDQFGDGDQTQLYGVEAMTLQAQASRGMDYCYNRESNLSGWSNACFLGDLEKVKQFLNATKSPIDLKELLERRESMMRFSGVFHVVLGARINPTQNHVAIAKYLVENGARVDARDTAGMTPLHYCVSQFGNSCTMEIAQLLLDNGADVNATNRFGATPLFEPCITAKYDFVEFLVRNGCNPKHTDSHGVSCYAYAMMNPKIKEIFVVNNKKMAEKEAAENETSDNILIVCTACKLESPSLKKCSGCLSVSYCSAECQKEDWKNHKGSCKTKQLENKENESVLIFHPTIHSPEQEGIVKLRHDAMKSTQDRAMKVKVQAVFGAQGPRPDKPMIVTDKSRTYKVWLLPTDPHFKKLFNLVVAEGYGGLKLYLTAVSKVNSELHINTSVMHPETW